MAPQSACARGSLEAVPEGGDASLSSSDWVQKLILQEERLVGGAGGAPGLPRFKPTLTYTSYNYCHSYQQLQMKTR